MKSKIKIIIAFSIIAIGIAVAAFFTYKSRIVPNNDISCVGNTAGNLNNGGLFVAKDDVVYFSNPYDKGCVYSMNCDESNFRKISTNSSSHLLIGGDYLYYYMDVNGGGQGIGTVIKLHGIYRSDLDGKHSTSIDSRMAINMQLVGNYVYYQDYNNTDFTTTRRVKIDGSESTQVSDTIINPSCAYNGKVYFNGTEKDHYLYAMDTETNKIITVYNGNLWYPQYYEGYIYYMDVGHDYRLCRYNLTTGQEEVLTNDRCDTFNVGQGYIYYQYVSDSPALKRMSLDGSNPEIVATGTYNSINLTSRYAYFKSFGDDTTIYHTPINGPVHVEVFEKAMQAAIDNQDN